MSSKPIHSSRVGGIQAAVWVNETKNGPMNSITIDKSYKDAGGEWKRTKNFKESDIPKIVVALQEVYKKLFLKDEVITPEKQEDF